MSWLFRKIDISTLVFFRIVFGILAFYDIWHFMEDRGQFKCLTGGSGFNFTYYGFEWVKPLPPESMYALCYFLLVLSVFVIVGYGYRFCCFVYGLGYTYIYLIEKAYYLNHGYLFAVLCFLMCLLPAHRAFSIDARLNPLIRTQLISYWPIFLLQLAMGVVYFYGGVAKLNPDWLRGFPLIYWLNGSEEEIPIIGHIIELDWVGVLMSYGGLILDLTAVFFLSNKRTRGFFIVAVIFFHAMNKIIFSIGIFPYMSLSLSLLYFSPNWPRRIAHRFFPNHVDAVATLDTIDTTPSIFSRLWTKRLIVGFVVAFSAYNILFPLRHFIIKGPTDWTEEGHCYSWHMMLRSKKGKGRFTVKIPSENRTIKIDTKEYLTKRQRKKLFTHPGMILQFAHFLRDKYQDKGYKDVEVYANVKSKFNGRDYAYLIDKTVDLAKECCHPLKHDEWILIRKDVYNQDHLKEKNKKKQIIKEKGEGDMPTDTIDVDSMYSN